MMTVKRPWYATNAYKHLDVQVDETFADKTASPKFVSSHSWLPLIRYIKRVKRYKNDKRKTIYKERTIMYASHRDACILKRYSRMLADKLNAQYAGSILDSSVIAYRSLGKANYQFSASAFQFAKSNMPCIVLCFDITGFFDHIDHSILKDRLKTILGVSELPPDWYAIFRFVTKHRSIERANLQKHVVFGPRLSRKSRGPVATIAEIKAARIAIESNTNRFGIPQGTPISSTLSNLYLLEFDRTIGTACVNSGAFYQRYSDDILIICSPETETTLYAAVEKSLAEHKLNLAADKLDRQVFDSHVNSVFQYLGFNISQHGAVIRPSSLSRQWRKAKRAIATTKRAGLLAIARGKATKIFVRNLRRRFSPVGARNFSSYARRADGAFGSKRISRQVARLERKIDAEIRTLQKP